MDSMVFVLGFNGFLSIEFSRVLWELFGICIDLFDDLCGVLCKM